MISNLLPTSLPSNFSDLMQVSIPKLQKVHSFAMHHFASEIYAIHASAIVGLLFVVTGTKCQSNSKKIAHFALALAFFGKAFYEYQFVRAGLSEKYLRCADYQKEMYFEKQCQQAPPPKTREEWDLLNRCIYREQFTKQSGQTFTQRFEEAQCNYLL